MASGGAQVVVVVPAYRVEREIGQVLEAIPASVQHIIVVDDGSPDETAEVVREVAQKDPRIRLIEHEVNQGVGGAMRSGYRKALELGADIVVKVDGDGQMPPGRISALVEPLLTGSADFSKGNRFREMGGLGRMPPLRRVGNAALGFLVRAATGYWDCFDPTNGFIAIRAELLEKLPMERLDRSYFFEISLLGYLYLLGAAVREIPFPARYAGERSSLSILKVLLTFPGKLLVLMVRRILLKYFVYDFSIASLYMLAGVPLMGFGAVFGTYNWVTFARLGVPAPTGTIMLATLPVILGFQLLLAAIGVDIQSVPKEPVCGPIRPHEPGALTGEAPAARRARKGRPATERHT
jgi:glycosyltransferase involved in cell wall biosynthesis